MTFILAVNLSDRIYLAADSMATKMVNGKREVAGYCLKLVPMGPMDHSSFVNCLFAGDKAFINYIFKRLDSALDEKIISTDINELLQHIDEFMKRIVPEYPGPIHKRSCKIIFAGSSNISGFVKKFRLDNLSDALGPEAGHLDDPNAVQGIQLGFVSVPDQKIFSYVIDVENNNIGIDEVGEMYSLIYGGSKKLTNEEKRLLLKHFLSKRTHQDEVRDIVNFLRSQFTDSIGGAITLGEIDYRKRLIYTGYKIDRSNKVHHTDWSFTVKVKSGNGLIDISTGTGLIATDPEGKEYDLGQGFYNLGTDEEGYFLEL
ncbi:MAG: hypothetical protein RLY66_347 [Candidatus Parcubacteria bacterium]|jgi:hypothetical protein